MVPFNEVSWNAPVELFSIRLFTVSCVRESPLRAMRGRPTDHAGFCAERGCRDRLLGPADAVECLNVYRGGVGPLFGKLAARADFKYQLDDPNHNHHRDADDS